MSKMAWFDIPELRTPIVFTSRPEAIPGDFRPLWRIGILLLILFLASRGCKSSLVRLHVLNWALRSLQNQQNLKDVVAGKMKPDAVLVRIEPSLNRAVDLAHGEGLVNRNADGRLSLTSRGKIAGETLCKEPAVFEGEKKFLGEIGKGVTEVFVNSFFKGHGKMP